MPCPESFLLAFLIPFPIIVLSCIVVILPSFQRLLPQSMPAGKSACPAPRCHTSSLLPYPRLSCCNKCRISACIGVRPSGFSQFAAGACHPDAMSAHFFVGYGVRLSPCPICKPHSFLISVSRGIFTISSFIRLHFRSLHFIRHALHSQQPFSSPTACLPSAGSW